MTPDNPLEVLQAHMDRLRALQKMTPYLIKDCRHAGLSWESLAPAMEVSRQEVMRRWAPQVKALDQFTAELQLPPEKAGPGDTAG